MLLGLATPAGVQGFLGWHLCYHDFALAVRMASGALPFGSIGRRRRGLGARRWWWRDGGVVGLSPLARIGSPPSSRLGAPYPLGSAPGTRLGSAGGAAPVFNLPRWCSSGEPQLMAGHLAARGYMVVVSPRQSEEAQVSWLSAWHSVAALHFALPYRRSARARGLVPPAPAGSGGGCYLPGSLQCSWRRSGRCQLRGLRRLG